MVSIKIHVGKYMDSGHYVCDVFHYSTVTWWNFDDDTITNYSGIRRMFTMIYQMNMNKKGEIYYKWTR